MFLPCCCFPLHLSRGQRTHLGWHWLQDLWVACAILWQVVVTKTYVTSQSRKIKITLYNYITYICIYIIYCIKRNTHTYIYIIYLTYYIDYVIFTSKHVDCGVTCAIIPRPFEHTLQSLALVVVRRQDRLDTWYKKTRTTHKHKSTHMIEEHQENTQTQKHIKASTQCLCSACYCHLRRCCRRRCCYRCCCRRCFWRRLLCCCHVRCLSWSLGRFGRRRCGCWCWTKCRRPRRRRCWWRCLGRRFGRLCKRHLLRRRTSYQRATPWSQMWVGTT